MASAATAAGNSSAAQAASADPKAANPVDTPSSGIAQQAAQATPNPSTTFHGFISLPQGGKEAKDGTSSHLRSKHFLSAGVATIAAWKSSRP
jgi:hypothetical protein